MLRLRTYSPVGATYTRTSDDRDGRIKIIIIKYSYYIPSTYVRGNNKNRPERARLQRANICKPHAHTHTARPMCCVVRYNIILFSLTLYDIVFLTLSLSIVIIIIIICRCRRRRIGNGSNRPFSSHDRVRTARGCLRTQS